MSRTNQLRITAGLAVLALLAAGGCQSDRRTSASPSPPSAAAVAESGAQAAPTHDAVLVSQIIAALQQDPSTSGLDIRISVSQGRARLSGFVERAAEKLRAGALAGEVDGVSQVDNRLILRHHTEWAADPLGEARVHL